MLKDAFNPSPDDARKDVKMPRVNFGHASANQLKRIPVRVVSAFRLTRTPAKAHPAECEKAGQSENRPAFGKTPQLPVATTPLVSSLNEKRGLAPLALMMSLSRTQRTCARVCSKSSSHAMDTSTRSWLGFARRVLLQNATLFRRDSSQLPGAPGQFK